MIDHFPKVIQITLTLLGKTFLTTAFYGAGEGREGFVVSLMAMLELDRSQLLEWQQAALFAPVNLRLRQSP